jgi:hypothetical protein
MWETMISEIHKTEERYGGRLNKPATHQEITNLQEAIHAKFAGFTLPTPYVDFLKKLNGLDFNGLVIYGVDRAFLHHDNEDEVHGFIETNEIWHENEWQQQYMFFGDSDTAWYCCDLKRMVFLELDKPSGTEMNSFDHFQAMLEEALSTRLD